jgi:hypothetical protein
LEADRLRAQGLSQEDAGLLTESLRNLEHQQIFETAGRFIVGVHPSLTDTHGNESLSCNSNFGNTLL